MVDRYGPCLDCGVVGYLGPGRDGGVDVYCDGCAVTDRPARIGAKRERKLSAVELDGRGVSDLVGYKRRNA